MERVVTFDGVSRQWDGEAQRSGQGRRASASYANFGLGKAPVALKNRRVLFVTSEMADFVKVGGLGEVSAALPRALNDFTDARVMIPGYREVVDGKSRVEFVGVLPGLADVPSCGLARLTAPDGLIVYVVLCPELYNRAGTPYADIHGEPWADSDLRFARLSLAAVQLAAGMGDESWTPSLLHLNDWQSALAAGYAEWLGVQTPSVLTVHNLAYQGLFSSQRLGSLGIPADAFKVDGAEFCGWLSYMKAGLFYASHITTVSQSYANEITRPELGYGLHGLLATRAREGRLTGILNGIDDSWEFDCGLGQSFATPDAWKQQHADAIRASFGLAVSRGPLFAIVSRLVHQKGVDLSIEVADDIINAGGQIIVTGRGERSFEDAMLALRRRHSGSVGVNIGFDDVQARQIFAGSDFLLMPSRFEPCGLSQMYAQKYGSLPIAHRTGGLIDTIEDGVTGFLFNSISAGAFSSAVRRAMTAFTSRGHLERMRNRAMSQDFAWLRSAHQYNWLYQSLI